MGGLPILIFILFGLLVIGIGIYGWYQSEQRRKALQEWASAKGWTFDSAKDRDFADRYPAFDCLRQGSGRYAYNLLQGRSGEYDCCGFDYHYETYTNDSKGNRQTHHHAFSGMIVDVTLPLKPLSIRPENFMDKVGQLLGFGDIDFESDEFNRQFHVKAADRRWAFDVLHQATMEFLRRQPRFEIQFDGHQVIGYRSGVFDLPEFEECLSVITGVIERLPEYVHREAKGE